MECFFIFGERRVKGLKTVLSFCCAAFLVTGGLPVYAQTLEEDNPMSFGAIVVDPLGDTVVLTPGGVISGQNLSVFSGMAAGGEFSAQGDPLAAISISFSSGDALTGAGTAMGLGTFTHNAGGTPAFNGAGNLTFNVGATLTINASQAAGQYSGTYTVFVDYP